MTAQDFTHDNEIIEIMSAIGLADVSWHVSEGSLGQHQLTSRRSKRSVRLKIESPQKGTT